MSITVWHDDVGTLARRVIDGMLDAMKEQTRAIVAQQIGRAMRIEPDVAAGNGNLSVAEAAKIARKKPATVREWIKDGRLKASKPKGSRHYLIAREDLDHCLGGEEATAVDVRALAASILKKGK